MSHKKRSRPATNGTASNKQEKQPTPSLQLPAETWEDWHAEARQTLARVAATKTHFAPADLRAAGLLLPAHGSHWAVLFALAARRGEIRQVGTSRTRRPAGRRVLGVLWTAGGGNSALV